MAKIDDSKIKKILVMRPDMIGDVVLITPAISALKKKFPTARVTLLIQEYTREVVEGNEDIDEIMIDRIKSGKAKGLLGYLNYAKSLRKENFDLAVNYYVDDLKYALLPLLARIPFRVGDKAKLINGLLYNIGARLDWRDPSKHIIELNLDLLKPLGIEESAPRLKVTEAKEELERIGEKLAEHGIQKEDIKIVLQVGTGGSNKSLLPEGYAKVSDSIVEAIGARVILSGGRNEKEAAEKAAKAAKHNPVNLAGKLTLKETVSLLRSCHALVSVDTGILHLAAALGVPTVAVFPTKFVKPSRWGPWGTENITLRSGTKCKLPCFPRRCRESFCIDDLNTERITSAIDDLLKGRGSKTIEESKRDWLKKSLNILLTAGGKDKKTVSRTISVLSKLKSADYNVFLATPKGHPLHDHCKTAGIQSYPVALGIISPPAIRKLLKIFAENDINIAHKIDQKGSINVFFAYLLSEALYLTPAVPKKDTELEFPDANAIIKFYLERPRKK